MHIPFVRATTLLLALLAATAGPARARDGRDVHDHDRARQALQAGEVLPLKAILARVEKAHPGQVMEVELERSEGRWIYEIKLLRAGGALTKLKVDARDATVLEHRALKGEPAPQTRQPGAQP
ncbi:MAG: PepSY domain-containing protein [Vitreoscilla sp.]|jgi:uncharacterized membrane protein YkoI|nr:PepSY domain-containing protein [Burkholderiales bacterium]MBP6336253.1 PepSY domain-containing protein [Vitreoscilla sp.]MBP6674656.1 PepSY domain-containing protein [Vitreoscilla sp.]